VPISGADEVADRAAKRPEDIVFAEEGRRVPAVGQFGDVDVCGDEDECLTDRVDREADRQPPQLTIVGPYALAGCAVLAAAVAVIGTTAP
jgi:hypothetical protein